MKRYGLAVLLLLAASEGRAAGNLIRGYVVGNGGLSSPPGSDGVNRLYGTLGQAAIGLSTNAGFRLCHGFWCFGGSRVVAVDPNSGSATPSELVFGLPAPNPSRGETRFSLALPKEAEVTLTVYDVGGRALGEPATRHLGAGSYQLYWGTPAGRSGVYFARLQVDGVVRAERRMVFVR